MKNSREEVLRALKLCAADDFEQCVAQKCPYLSGDADGTCFRNLIADVAEVMEHSEPIVNGVWRYYVNEEGKARWRCSVCGHVVKHDPNDFKRCACGARMKKES